MTDTLLFADHAYLPDGWRRNVLLRWDAAGTLTDVTPDTDAPAGVARAAGPVLPGMPNLHSHAFQRAMAGLTEYRANPADSFWSWRDLMYRFALKITPDALAAIARWLYVEMLKCGYTSVCEFHYVQREPGGAWYVHPAEMAERVTAAAQQAGIGLTLLPVLYSYAGFGEQPLRPEQQRFRTGVADVVRIAETLAPHRSGQFEVGAAPHSLRAASAGQIRELAAALPPDRPLHIHVAEQQGEVEQSLAVCGKRPVEYLMERVGIDERWCLVHATHLVDEEIEGLAASGAVAGLCPTTEANLGDGLFPLRQFIDAGGRFGIGSDSHVSHSPVEELRWLEYGQRLARQARNVAATGHQRDVGQFLWQSALAGGAQASGRRVGALEAGRRADLLVLDGAHPNLDGVADDEVLGRVLFCGNDNLVRDVLAGGHWVVQGGRHMAQDAIGQRYRRAVQQLREVRA
jgi:formimidoylglutamate deiminase